MKARRQRGILLLPVALTLAIVGALAYTMTREGSMDVSAVDARYDTEVARYLAEAGLNLAKWQNAMRGCGNDDGFGTVTLPGGQIVSDDVDSKNGGSNLSVSLTATTNRGAVHSFDDVVVPMVDLADVGEVTVSSGSDTTIRDGSTNLSGADYLETSDGKSHGVISFSLPSQVRNAAVISAILKLTQVDTKSTQPVRSLAVHRVTRDWSAGSATWTAPWSSPGGDYAPNPAATVDIAGNAQYSWRIDALVQDWTNKTSSNYGVLLKPSGLLDARFGSFERSGSKPQLTVRYFPRC
jgi:hypothetical protein